MRLPLFFLYVRAFGSISSIVKREVGYRLNIGQSGAHLWVSNNGFVKLFSATSEYNGLDQEMLRLQALVLLRIRTLKYGGDEHTVAVTHLLSSRALVTNEA